MSTKRRQTLAASRQALTQPMAPRPANVIDLKMRVLDRHMETLTRWLDAGRAMGLCDAASYGPDKTEGAGTDYVLIWVRENPNPAYMVAPEGMHWTITDCIRSQMLARVRSFEEALTLIRPVLIRATA
jgi:hypothetical protein